MAGLTVSEHVTVYLEKAMVDLEVHLLTASKSFP